MKKTFLIPTDFSVKSINLAKSILNNEYEGGKIEIIFLCGVELSTSISDLLFFSKRDLLEKLSSKAFDEGCEILKNKYASAIYCLRKDLFHGTTQSSFNQYLVANKVDSIFVPASYQFVPVNKYSKDLSPFIRRCQVEAKPVQWNDTLFPENGNLAEVFFSPVTTG